MKKAYTLLITIILVTFFSYIGILILETKALRNENLSNQYLYIQGKNHINFLKSYIKDLDLKNINHLQIEDDLFDIYATINTENQKYIINFYVKAKDYDVSIHEKIIKE
jgi:hypothetical protein